MHPDFQDYYRGTRREAWVFVILFFCSLALPLAVLLVTIHREARWLPLLLPFALYIPLFLLPYVRQALRTLRYLRRATWVLAQQPAHGVHLTCKLGWHERWTWNATVRAADLPQGNETTFRLLYTDRLWEIDRAFSDTANIYYDVAPRGPIVLESPQGIFLVDRDAPVDQEPEDIVAKLHPAPRHLPGSLWWRELLGGARTQVGWVVLGLAMILVWRLVLAADISSDLLLRGTLPTSSATVTAVEETPYHDFGFAVIKFHYVFHDMQGRRQSGVGYHTIVPQVPGPYADLTPGMTLPVQYRQEFPTVSQVMGARRVPYGASNVKNVPIGIWHALAVLALGLLCLLPGVVRGGRRMRFLKRGVATMGARVSCTFIGTRAASGPAEDPVYQMTVRYTDQDGTARTWNDAVIFPASYGDTPVVLYDPCNPDDAMLLPKLNEQAPFFIDGKGNIRVRRAVSMWELVIALPVVGGYLFLLFYILGRPLLEIAGWYPLW